MERERDESKRERERARRERIERREQRETSEATETARAGREGRSPGPVSRYFAGSPHLSVLRSVSLSLYLYPLSPLSPSLASFLEYIIVRQRFSSSPPKL